MDRNVRKNNWMVQMLILSSDYDAIVDQSGCAGSGDTLDCLRKVDYKVLKAAIDESPFIFDYQVRYSCLPSLVDD